MTGNIGEKIRTVRKDAGLTQTQLAERMGVTKQNVHLYETGEINPKIDTVVKFAEALKVPVEYLLSTESDCVHHWVSVKVHLPELDDDEPFARCIVNVIRWCEGWTGIWNQPEPDLNEEEFTAAAAYNPEQKTFTVYDGFGGSMVINALLDPTDFSGASGTRITHWMPMPMPFGVLKEEELRW